MTLTAPLIYFDQKKEKKERWIKEIPPKSSLTTEPFAVANGCALTVGPLFLAEIGVQN